MMSDLELLNSSEENLKWFQKNSGEIQKKHSQKVIAIKDRAIVAIASGPLSLIKELKSKGIDESEVLIEKVGRFGEIIIL